MSGISNSRKPLIQLGQDPNDCWGWLATVNESGVPIKGHEGKTGSARRWLWTMLFGPLPHPIKISVSCGNSGCMNPHHFYATTNEELSRNGAAAKLMPGDIAEIWRVRKTATPQDIHNLAAKFDVSYRAIEQAMGRGKLKTWVKHRAPAALADAFGAIPKGGLTAAARATQVAGHSPAAP